jgi:hypothetical protein
MKDANAIALHSEGCLEFQITLASKMAKQLKIADSEGLLADLKPEGVVALAMIAGLSAAEGFLTEKAGSLVHLNVDEVLQSVRDSIANARSAPPLSI